ncbi:MAG: trigger factor [Eubacteriales bacterium]|nr:trigger factor [Eubacteriales bacterium]
MKAEFLNRDGNTISMTMEVTADEFEDAINAVYLRNKSQIQVPGFRKGKAPRRIIENNYGKGIFIEDAVTDVFNKFYPEAINELGYEPVDHPDIDLGDQEVKSGNGILFNIKFLTEPEVHLESYKGVEVSIPEVDVTNRDIENALNGFAMRNARLVHVDREARMNDTVVLDYKGFLEDGTQFEGGTAENYKLKLGSNSFIPGFEDQLIGAEPGEERTVDVKFPENYHSEDLADKVAKFECKIDEVLEEQLPEIDDDLARECSEFDTLDEWKEDIRKNITESREKQKRDHIKNEAVKVLYDEAIIDIPEVMIDHEVDNLLQQFDQQLSYSGMSLDEYLSATQDSIDNFKDTVRADAERKVRSNLIVQEVARQEGLTATEEEIDEELKRMSSQYGVTPEKMREMVGPDINIIKKDIASRKALDIIADNAVVTETPIMPEDGLETKEATDEEAAVTAAEAEPAETPAE